jgi:protein-S-isoprenylcysteine O-methyltransferase Ste14
MTMPKAGPQRTPVKQTALERAPGSEPVRAGEKGGPGAAILLVLAPLLCCGGPLILAGLATASAATLGAIGGVIGALLITVGAWVWVRHRRRNGTACRPAALRAGRS